MRLGKEVFVALAAVIWCDGEVSEKEAAALLKAARAWGVAGADYAEVERCINDGVPLDIIATLQLEQQARFLVYALGSWLTRVDGVVVPTEDAILDRLAATLELSEQDRILARSDGMMAAAIMGASTGRDVVSVAGELEARADVGFEETVRVKLPPQ